MITEQQSKMIDYLIQGETKTDIGKLLGVSRQTIHVWSHLRCPALATVHKVIKSTT